MRHALRSPASWFRILPLLIVLMAGLVLPFFYGGAVSVRAWDHSKDEFRSGLTTENYSKFLGRHRGGVVLECLRLALFVAFGLFVILVPLLIALRLTLSDRSLAWLELLLVVPLLGNQALRLHSLKLALIANGPLANSFGGAFAEIVDRILFSNFGVAIGLSLSYGAYFALPALQGLRAVPSSIICAAGDIGFGARQKMRLLARLAFPNIGAGLLLFTVAAWFSSLEYEVLGKRQSMLAMLQGLVAVKKIPEVFAFSTVTSAATLTLFLVVCLIVRPERLVLGYGFSKEK